NTIVEKNKELEVYIRLEDYKRDKLKESDRNLQEQERLYRKFNQQLKRFDQTVENIYAKQLKRNGAIGEAYQQMTEATVGAKRLLDLWQHNMEGGTPTQEFPFDAMVTYINYLDSIDSAPNYSRKIKGQLSSVYAKFRSNITSDVIKTLRYALNKHTYLNRQEDLESNRSYDNLNNYYNSLMINWFNQFVLQAQKDGHALHMKAKYSPVFRLRSQPKYYNMSIRPYQRLYVGSVSSLKQNIAVSKATVKALNYYLEFVNREVKINTHVYQKLTDYNIDMIRYIIIPGKRYDPQYRYHGKQAFPFAEFHRALFNSKYIPKESRDPLNNRLQIVLNIAREREALEIGLEKYSEQKGHKKDDFAKGKEMLQRFDFILKEYDKQINALQEDLKTVLNTYEIKDPDNNWRISGDALSQLTDSTRLVLHEAKLYCRRRTDSIPKTQTVRKMVRETIVHQYENMRGVYKLGRSHGHCPYTPYEDLPQMAKRVTDKAEIVDSLVEQRSKRSKKSGLETYEDILYPFNEMVDDWNKFAWLALGETEIGRRKIAKPVYMLYRMRQPLFYDYKSPSGGTKVKKVKKRAPLDPENGEMKGFAYNNLVLLLDVSSSMKAPHKFPLLKKSFVELLSILRSRDEVALVSYSGKANVVLKPTSCSLRDTIASAINRLEARGGTDAQKGLKLAYKSARKNFIENGNNRIILATDGQFRLTESDFKQAQKYAEKGIRLTLFYFGDVKQEIVNLKKLTEAGKGNYVLITQENMMQKLKDEMKAIKMN
ncbi:MAG: VWA domain-containing protein, partial [Okeania sp. SIO3C4]|nr:VWA domain-containing protein [Okeania sp. SIO3C4]